MSEAKKEVQDQVKDIMEKYDIEPYNPSEDDRDFIVNAYSKYQECYNIKHSGQDILNGMTLQSFWDRCNYDYNVIVTPEDENDPVTPYSSTITRDRANAFISNLSSQYITPGVIAQNKNQQVDRVLSRVSNCILEWAHDNDGRPSNSGHKKQVDNVHKMVIEGTVHVQDDVVDGKLVSTLVNNEEIFIPNFFQSDLQLQPRLFRVKDDILYEEAERQFGNLPNWKYVMPGSYEAWGISEDPRFKERYDGIISEDRVQVIYYWEDIPRELFKKYGIPKKRKKAKLFNVLINGVLMFKTNTLMPYHDGNFPITKEIFESFSKAEYYWGNSMPGKAREDKRWFDGWKTLMRHKAKLSAIPPLLTFNGSFVDSDIYIPGEVTEAPQTMTKDDVIAVPGITGGITNSDIAILKEGKDEFNEGNMDSQAMGVQTNQKKTATESEILDDNAQRIFGAFSLRVAFLVEARTFPILKRLFQFLPREKVKQLCIPDQALPSGKQGSIEILFKKPAEMTEEQELEESYKLKAEERESEKMGSPKQIIHVNPKYLNEVDLFIKAVADPKPKKTSSYRERRAIQKYQLYKSDPENFNVKPAARNLVREMGDDENEIIRDASTELPEIPGQENKQLKNAQPTKVPAKSQAGGMGEIFNTNM